MSIIDRIERARLVLLKTAGQQPTAIYLGSMERRQAAADSGPYDFITTMEDGEVVQRIHGIRLYEVREPTHFAVVVAAPDTEAA